MFKKVVLCFIILCSLHFYTFSGLGNAVKLFEIAAIGLILSLLTLYSIYDSSSRIKKNFTPYILIILLSIPGSMVIAAYFHDQPISITAYEQRGMYFYCLYFLLPIFKPRPESIQKLFFVFGFLYMFIYIIQYFLYPTVLLETRVMQDRGTIRINLPGTSYLLLSYYFSVQEIMKSTKRFYLVYCFLVFLILFLMGGRQMIFYTMIMTIGILFFNKKIKSKVLLALFIIVSFVTAFFLFKNIFTEVIEVSKTTSEEGVRDIRVRAASFYLTTVFPNKLSYVLGNGVPNNRSAYGQMMSRYSEAFDYSMSDIGIIANYISFGVLFVIGVIFLLIRILKIEVEDKYKYLKYFFIMILALLFMAKGFQESEFIVTLCLCLYLMDVSVTNKKIQVES